MKRYQSLEEVDRKILEIISHYENLAFVDLWYEIGEDDALKEQIMTTDDALKKLGLLTAQGYVECIRDEDGMPLWIIKNPPLEIVA